ncbi:coiled-coil domain-containing protein 17 isoform X3 [Columba livia]|uniref:coiled-coil domain-containing protein 17 isoform X3 n=1 Tax=Columba livia TaxID=8932 RepID=UPI0031BA6D0F
MKLRKCICVVEKWGKFQVPPVSSVVAAARDERSWVEGEPAKGAAGPELCASGQTLHPRACVWLYLDALLQRYRPRESRVGRIPINQPAAFSSESVFRDRYPWWCSGTVTCSPLRTASCSGGQAPCARGKQRESPGPEERPPSLPVQRSNGGGKHRGHCRAGRPMAAAGGFSCPRCSMVFGSGPLLRAHQEKLCLGTPAGSSSRGPGGDPLPVEGAPGTVRRPRHSWVVWSGVWCGVCGAGTGMGAGLGCAWVRKRGHSHHGWIQPDLSWGDPPSSPLHCVGDSQCLFWQSQESFCYLAFFHPFLPIGLPEFGVSQHRDRAEPHRLLILPGLPPAARGQRGPERVRGAPLGDVLTPRERVLLRMADPSARKPTLEQGEHPRPPAPARGHQQPLQELLETHQRHVAEIRARTQQLEQQREELCRRLAALGAGGAADPQPEQGELELSRDQAGWLRVVHGGATVHLDTLVPATGPLAAEARALRLSYLRAGGRDPAILQQLLHLQVEATALEKGTAGLCGSRRTEPPGTGARGLDAALLAMELENRRLEDELLALKVRRKRRADAGAQVAQRHAEELARLQTEVGMLRSHVEQTGPRPPPAILPPPVAPPLLPAMASPELFMESPQPALGTGGPAAPGRACVLPSLLLAPSMALEDPPPAQEPPAQHKQPQSCRCGGLGPAV